tara:strand:+ start:285 stop:497 length:213 start_codon:yes stop_codon:yes gene_type:complete
MEFKEMLKEQNLENDLDKYKKDNEITYNLECAVAEFMLNQGNLSMWRELNDNGDPSELVAEFLEKGGDDE